MENKRKKGLVITIIILLILVLGLAGYIVYDKVINKKLDVKENGSAHSKTFEVTKKINPYKNYSNVKWQKTTTINMEAYGYIASIVKSDSNLNTSVLKVDIINPETKSVINSRIASEIIGAPKYIAFSEDCGGPLEVAILTEDGDIYLAKNLDQINGKFSKLNTQDKFIEIAALENISFSTCYTKQFYFLNTLGKLVNTEGKTWEEINPNIDFIFADDIELYVYKNRTVSNRDIKNVLMYNNEKISITKSFIVQKQLGNIPNTEHFPTSMTIYLLTDKNDILYIQYIDPQKENIEAKLYKSNVKNIEQIDEDKTSDLDNKVKITYKDNTTETIDNANIQEIVDRSIN